MRVPGGIQRRIASKVRIKLALEVVLYSWCWHGGSERGHVYTTVAQKDSERPLYSTATATRLR